MSFGFCFCLFLEGPTARWIAVRADDGERSEQAGPLEMTAGLDAKACLASFAKVECLSKRTVLFMAVCPRHVLWLYPYPTRLYFGVSIKV